MSNKQKIRDACKEYKTGSMEWMVGQSLLKIAEADDKCAELIAQDLENEQMNISSFFGKMKDYARKHQKNGCFCFSPEEFLELAVSFYGLSVSAKDLCERLVSGSMNQEPSFVQVRSAATVSDDDTDLFGFGF